MDNGFLKEEEIQWLKRQASDLFLYWTEYFYKKIDSKTFFNMRLTTTKEVRTKYGQSGYDIFFDHYNKLISTKMSMIYEGSKVK